MSSEVVSAKLSGRRLELFTKLCEDRGVTKSGAVAFLVDFYEKADKTEALLSSIDQRFATLEKKIDIDTVLDELSSIRELFRATHDGTESRLKKMHIDVLKSSVVLDLIREDRGDVWKDRYDAKHLLWKKHLREVGVIV